MASAQALDGEHGASPREVRAPGQISPPGYRRPATGEDAASLFDLGTHAIATAKADSRYYASLYRVAASHFPHSPFGHAGPFVPHGRSC